MTKEDIESINGDMWQILLPMEKPERVFNLKNGIMLLTEKRLIVKVKADPEKTTHKLSLLWRHAISGLQLELENEGFLKGIKELELITDSGPVKIELDSNYSPLSLIEFFNDITF